MSWEAAAWAVRKGKDYDLNPITRYVMLTLANYADKEGNDIYPSISTLEHDTGLGEKTIRRHIKHLMDCRLLEYGDQSIVANNPRFRKDRLPKVYRFIFTPGQSDHPSPVDNWANDRSLSPQRPVTRPVTVTDKPINRKDKPVAPAASTSLPVQEVDDAARAKAREEGRLYRLQRFNARRAKQGLPPVDSIEGDK